MKESVQDVRERVYVFSNRSDFSEKRIRARRQQLRAYLEDNRYEMGGSLSINVPMSRCIPEIKEAIEHCRLYGISKIVTNCLSDIAETPSDVLSMIRWLGEQGISVETVNFLIRKGRERTMSKDSTPAMEM